MVNRKKKENMTSKYIGVCWDIYNKNWVTSIRINGEKIQIGRFKNDIEGAKAYDKYARKHHGEFASLNFPDEEE